MSQQDQSNGNFQVINRPNMLKAKLGSSPGIDPAVIEQAEQVIEEMRDDFSAGVSDELIEMIRIIDATAAVDAEERAEHVNKLFRIAHELRGQGGTFGFPLVTDIGGLLCGYIESLETRGDANIEVVRAYAVAFAAVITNEVRDGGGLTGANIVENLRQLNKRQRH